MHRAALVLLAACSGSTSTAPVDDHAVAASVDNAKRAKDTIVAAMASDVGNLISVVSQLASDSEIYNITTYPTLDWDFDCGIRYKPALATEWSWNADGTVLTMKLRDDVQWADGVKVTAHDVKFTYDLIADPQVASPRVDSVSQLVPGKAPWVVDDRTLEWHFLHAYDKTTQLGHVAFTVIPKHVFEGTDRASLRGHARKTDPLASGAMKVALYEPNARIVLEPNLAYSGDPVYYFHTKRFIGRVMPEYSTRLLELQKGSVDVMEQINVADADALRAGYPNVTLYRKGWRSNDYVAWNLKNPLFSDKRVRQALAHGTDVDKLIHDLLTGSDGTVYARRAVGSITPELCKVHNDEITPFPYDVEKAKALLAEAGWTDTDGDGFVDREGKKFAFTVTTNKGNKRREDAVILMQSMWKKIGVDATIDTLETNQFYENLRKRDFEAAMGGWSAGLYVDPSPLWRSDEPDKRREFNFTTFSNPRVDELIDKGLQTPEESESTPMWREMQAIIYDEQPYLFLYWQDEIVGVSSRFENVKPSVKGTYANVSEWTVSDANVKYAQ
jgi:peptide/nickel transport system substrate-binding protein